MLPGMWSNPRSLNWHVGAGGGAAKHTGVVVVQAPLVHSVAVQVAKLLVKVHLVPLGTSPPLPQLADTPAPSGMMSVLSMQLLALQVGHLVLHVPLSHVEDSQVCPCRLNMHEAPLRVVWPAAQSGPVTWAAPGTVI